MGGVERLMRVDVPKGTPADVVKRAVVDTKQFLHDSGFDPGDFRLEIRERLGPGGRTLWGAVTFVLDEAPGDVKQRWKSRKWMRDEQATPTN